MATLADVQKHLLEVLDTAYDLTAITSGLSGVNVAVGRARNSDGADGGDVFVKWSSTAHEPLAGAGSYEAAWGGASAETVRSELAHLTRIGFLQHPNLPRLVHGDWTFPLLVIQAVTVDAHATWDTAAWRSATGTLACLRTVSPATLPSVCNWPGFRDRGSQTVDDCTHATGGDRDLAGYLAGCYRQMRQLTSREVTCHGDTHPGNWLLTEGGPVLIDFEHLATGPVGFDEAFLVTHLDLPLTVRLAWLGEADVDRDIARIVSGACAARIATGLRSEHPGWRHWCDQHWKAAVRFAAALA